MTDPAFPATAIGRFFIPHRDLGWIDVDGQCIVVPDIAVLNSAFEENIGPASE
jgi:hypothetical protein